MVSLSFALCVNLQSLISRSLRYKGGFVVEVLSALLEYGSWSAVSTFYLKLLFYFLDIL